MKTCKSFVIKNWKVYGGSVQSWQHTLQWISKLKAGAAMNELIETLQTVGVFITSTLVMYALSGPVIAIFFSTVCGLALLATLQTIIEGK